MLAKAGSFNSGTGAVDSTQEITIGFEAKVIFFWWSGRAEATDTCGGANHHRGFGVATSTSARYCIDTRSLDAQTSAVSSHYVHNAACIVAHTDAVLNGAIDISAIGPTSFTLIVDDTMPYDLRVHYLALGGSDVVNAASGISLATSGGIFDVSGLGFQPNFAMLVGSSTILTPPAGNGTNGVFCLGAATSGVNQACLSAGSDDASANMDCASWSTDEQIYALIAATVGTTISNRNDFDAFDADGFATKVDGAAPISQNMPAIYIALNCTNVIVGNSLTRTDGNDIVVSGLGWMPAAGMVFSHCKAESVGTTLDRDDETSIGAFTSATERVAHGVRDTDALADSQVTTAVEHDAVYVNMDASDAIEGLMDVKSVDDGGVTFVMDDADPAAAYFWYILFGPAEGAPPAGQPTMIRTQGVPTGSGRRDRPAAWNAPQKF